MVKLFGKELTRREVEARTGALSQFAGVRLMTLGDGTERGIRMLEFRTGTGLRFTVLVDRALDIGDLEYRGMAIGWHSPAGFRAPGLSDSDAEAGLGFLRAFSGLLATCGLTHALGPSTEDASHFHLPQRKTIPNPQHGRITMEPARLTGYGERWEGDECVLWCEGVVRQSAVFGENLHLIRRIEVKVGSNDVRIADTVVNRGFYRTPHMLLYHFNVGHPLLDAGSRYLAPISQAIWAGHAGDTYKKQAVGYRTMPAPQSQFAEQVWEYGMDTDAAGHVPVALVNDRLGLGFQIETRKDQLPCHLQWQNFQEGSYCLGMEPGTHHVLGKPFAAERNEMIWLEHGEERRYDIALSVLDGAGEITAAADRIGRIRRQPDDDYPPLSGNFPPLGKPQS